MQGADRLNYMRVTSIDLSLCMYRVHRVPSWRKHSNLGVVAHNFWNMKGGRGSNLWAFFFVVTKFTTPTTNARKVCKTRILCTQARLQIVGGHGGKSSVD